MIFITKVTYYGINRNPKETAYLAKCSIIFNKNFMVHNVTVLNGAKDRYILMPKKPNKDGYVDNSKNNIDGGDIFHPVDSDFAKYVSSVVLEGYSKYERCHENFSTYVYLPESGEGYGKKENS